MPLRAAPSHSWSWGRSLEGERGPRPAEAGPYADTRELHGRFALLACRVTQHPDAFHVRLVIDDFDHDGPIRES